MAKACAISAAVKKRVWNRDGGECIVCHTTHASPEAHFIRRSRGGLGVEENIVTLCRECHRRFDEGAEDEQLQYKCLIEAYLRSVYPGWDQGRLVFDKWDYKAV